jgi:hypothetical protein
MRHRIDQNVDRDCVGADRELVKKLFRFTFALPAIGDVSVVGRNGKQALGLVEQALMGA